MILGIARRIFAPIAAAFLVYFAWDAREALLETIGTGEPWHLAGAVLIWSLMHLISPMLPTVVFRARSQCFSYHTATEIHIANLPARYIPGGIWHTVGRIAGFKRLGIDQRHIAVFVFLENVLAVGVAFMIGGFLVALFNGAGWRLLAVCAAGGGLILLVVAPLLLRHRVVKGSNCLRSGDYLASIAVVALSCCVGAAAFVFYVSAFPGLYMQSSPLELGGVYLFSWGVGFVSVFAPQGIGVFELLAAELLRGVAPLKEAAALLAGFRLVIMVADGFTWALLRALSGIVGYSKKPWNDSANGA